MEGLRRGEVEWRGLEGGGSGGVEGRKRTNKAGQLEQQNDPLYQ